MILKKMNHIDFLSRLGAVLIAVDNNFKLLWPYALKYISWFVQDKIIILGKYKIPQSGQL